MSMRTDVTDGRQAYEKPTLRTINLVAEEVMAVGCKLPSGSGPAPGACSVPMCFSPGS